MRKLTLLLLGALVAISGTARAQTNYPAEATVEVRDANGNLITADVGVYPGDPLTVHSTGWAALVLIQATWFSDPVDLGKHPTDAKGVLDFTFTVPNVQPIPGVHTLRLEGLGANGQNRVVEVAIKVIPRPTSGPGANGGTGAAVAGGGGGNGSQVLGSTLENSAKGGSGSSTFAKTGAFIARWAAVGFLLLVVGATLALAVRKRREPTRYRI